jgi:hypothetical protein
VSLPAFSGSSLPFLDPGTSVEVMTRPNTWEAGFVVAARSSTGYTVHRGDGSAVPMTFEFPRVRPEAAATTALVAHVVLGNMGTVCSALNSLTENWTRLPEEDRLSILAIAERQALHVYSVLGEVVRGLPDYALERAMGGERPQ